MGSRVLVSKCVLDAGRIGRKQTSWTETTPGRTRRDDRSSSSEMLPGTAWRRMNEADLTVADKKREERGRLDQESLLQEGQRERERTERKGRREDYDGDDERDQRVRVEPQRRRPKRDDESTSDDSDVTERVSEDVQEDALHVHRPVAVPSSGGLFVVRARVAVRVTVALFGVRLFVRVGGRAVGDGVGVRGRGVRVRVSVSVRVRVSGEREV